MNENEDIEKKLQEFRDGRDESLPSNRRLLPVHKDRLLAEARRIHGGPASPGIWGFLRPLVRVAVVATPLLLLVFAGYLWLKSPDTARSTPLSQVSSDKKAEAKKIEGFAQAEAPSTAAEPVAQAPLKQASRAADALQAAADDERHGEQSDLANAVFFETLDVSGNYRAQLASGKDQDVSGQFRREQFKADRKKGVLAEGRSTVAPISAFDQFTVLQTANTITIVDSSGSRYVGELIPQAAGNKPSAELGRVAGAGQANEKQREFSVQVSNQAVLHGTNLVTRQAMSIIANFYAEPVLAETESAETESDRQDLSKTRPVAEEGAVALEDRNIGGEAGARDAARKVEVEKLKAPAAPAESAPETASTTTKPQNHANAPVRLRVVLERLDAAQQTQETLTEAERQ